MIMSEKLRTFAKRRAVASGIAAGIVNLIILYIALRETGHVPLFALMAEKWNHSLIGAFIPRALVISIVITFTTVWATLKAHSEDGLENIPWIKITLIKALIRALLAFLFVLALALILRGLFPAYAVISTSLVIPLVGVFAGAVAFYMTYSAVLSTEGMVRSEE